MASENANLNENERKTIRMKKDLVQTIDRMANDDNRTFNNMVETLLLRSIKHYEIQ